MLLLVSVKFDCALNVNQSKCWQRQISQIFLNTSAQNYEGN